MLIEISLWRRTAPAHWMPRPTEIGARPIAFVAMQAGAAAWMAPVWNEFEGARRVILAPATYEHLSRRSNLPPDAVKMADVEAVIELCRDAGVLVASATGAPIEAAAVRAAEARGIASVQVIDTWGPYRRRFVGGVWPGRIAVVDETAQSEAIADGLQAEAIIPIGQPAWELVPVLPSAPRNVVAFVGQPVARNYGSSLPFDEQTAWAALLEAARRDPADFREIIYVLHPEQDDSVPTAGREATRDAASALVRAGTIVGMFSSLMIDALLGGRRVVSLQPGAGTYDPCPLSRHGRVPRAESAVALIKSLGRLAPCETSLAGRFAGSRTRALAFIGVLAA